MKLSAILTVVIHYSDILVNFFVIGKLQVESVHVLPVYPCNVVMWMLLICSFLQKDNIFFKLLSEFAFIVGSVCAIVGIVFNANFDQTPTLLNYEVLKGLLSHSVMLFGCIYLKTAGYVKLRVFNALSSAFGFFVFVLCGASVNWLYTYKGLTPPDGMLLLTNPYIPIPTVFLGLLIVLVMFLALALYELRLPKEDRWYSKLGDFLREKNNEFRKRDV